MAWAAMLIWRHVLSTFPSLLNADKTDRMSTDMRDKPKVYIMNA